MLYIYQVQNHENFMDFMDKIRKALEDGIPPSSNFARNRHANLHVAKAMW